MRIPYLKVGPKDFAPIIPIYLLGKEGWLGVEAYVDSGATVSIFSPDRAEILGIEYRKGNKIHLTVGDGGLIEVYLVIVSAELAGKRFKAQIGFSDQLGVRFNLLGRRSFFDRFRFCFDDAHYVLEISPHR